MTDAEYVLEQLRAHPRDAMQIISASIRDRGVGLTVHSRVADLRAQGYVVSCKIEGKTRKGRDRYVYRLLASEGVVPDASEPSADSPSGGVPHSFPAAGQVLPGAGSVESPAVEREPQAIPAAQAMSAAPLNVIPGQLRLVG